MKKRLSIFLLSFGLLVTLSVTITSVDKAQAADTIGVYIAGTGGVPIPSTMYTSITDNTTGNITNQDLHLNSGWFAGGKLGWQMPFTKRWLAIEAEYNHMENKFDSGTQYLRGGNSITYDGNVKIDAGMMNLIVRYPEGVLHPYIGGGAGYARVQLDDIRRSINGLYYLNTIGGTKSVFAYQFMLGLDFDLTDHIFMGVAYKYFAANKAQFDTEISITTPLFVPYSHPGTVEVDYKAHMIAFTVGFIF